MSKYLGENTTQPYISKVILENTEDQQMKVTVKVAIKNRKAMGPELRDSMVTSIIKVTDGRIIEEFSKNNKNSNTQLIENARYPGKFGALDLSIAEVKSLPRGSEEYKDGFHIVAQEFYVKRNISDLTFYVVCQYDLDHPRYSKLKSSDNFKRKIINNSSIAAEDVFRNGKIIKESSIFIYNEDTLPAGSEVPDYSIVRGNKRIWTGPVSRHPLQNPRSDGYVGYVGVVAGQKGPKLKLTSSPNSTIHDYRIFDIISKIQIVSNLRENKLLAHKRNAYFSDLYITSDMTGKARMFFAINMGEILKDNITIQKFVASRNFYSINPDPTKTSFEGIINLSKINNISIRRERVNKAGEPLEGDNFIKVISESNQAGTTVLDSVTQTVSVRNENINSLEGETLGSIREIKNLFAGSTNTSGIRYFTVLDNAMLQERGGNFKYSIKLNIEDGSISFLKEMHKALVSGLVAFESYYKDIREDFTLNPAYFKHEQGPWVWALNFLIKTIRTFGNRNAINIRDLEKNLYMLSSPSTCTVESLTKIVDLYRDFTFKIRNMVEALPIKSNKALDDIRPDTSKFGNQIFPQSFTINHSFPETYEIKNNNDTGYAYFGHTQKDSSLAGLSTINYYQWGLRTMQETLRYFNIGINNNKDLSSTAYSFLTPVELKLKDRVFRTYIPGAAGKPLRNTSDVYNFNVLMNIYLYKKYNKPIMENAHSSTENEKSKGTSCNKEDNLFSQKLNSFSTYVKNNLSNVMSDINVVALKKYDSACFNKSEVNETDYAKLMMPATAADRYKSEISPRDIRESHENEEAGDAVNASFILAPLFYMHMLDLPNEICYLGSALNTVHSSIITVSENKYNFLPNQLKAMVLGQAGEGLGRKDRVVTTSHTWYKNGEPALKHLQNAAFYYLNIKNLVVVEALVGFENNMIVAPTWQELRSSHVLAAAQKGKTNLFCRLRPYTNEEIHFKQNKLLDLNIFDQYFILDVSGAPTPPLEKNSRKTQLLDKMTLLDNTALLKLESNFMRTNLKFGQVMKMINSDLKQFKYMKKTPTPTPTPSPAPTPASSPAPSPAGMTDSGGDY